MKKLYAFLFSLIAIVGIAQTTNWGSLRDASKVVTNEQDLVALSRALTNGGVRLNGTTLSNGVDITISSGGNVASVFGRTGVVVAASGDYTADQVGAVATNDTRYLAALTNASAFVSTNDTRYLAAMTNVSVICAGGWRNPTYWYLTYEDYFRSAQCMSITTNYDILSSNITRTMYADKQFYATFARGFALEANPVWSVQPTNYAAISSLGMLTTITSGLVRVSCIMSNASSSEAKAITVALSPQDPTVVTSITYFAADSARYILATNVDALVAGGTTTWHRSYWSTADHATATYVRDTQCWAKDVDLSGVVVSTGGSGPYWHGTLVTTQHIIMVKHAYNGVGSMKRFVGASGTVYERTIIAVRDPWPADDWSENNQDIVLGLLSASLPTNDVACYGILPANYTNQFPNGLGRTPAITYDQLLRANLCDMQIDSWQRQPADQVRSQFYSIPYVGDSGRPTFLLLPSGKLVLLHLFTYATGGSSILAAKADINAALSVDGAALIEADLSALKNYYP